MSRYIVECTVNVEVEVDEPQDIDEAAMAVFTESISPITLRSVEIGDWSVTL